MLQKRIDDQPSISREMVREAQEILHQHLKRVGLKQTAQRDTILCSFLETRDHLSTDELHRLVQKKDAKWTSWSRKSGADTTTLRPVTPSRFMASVKTAAGRI